MSWLPLVDILRTREAIANGDHARYRRQHRPDQRDSRRGGRHRHRVLPPNRRPTTTRAWFATSADNGLAGSVLPDRVAISNEDGVRADCVSRDRSAATLLSAARQRRSAVSRDSTAWIAHLGVPADDIRYVKADTQGARVVTCWRRAHDAARPARRACGSWSARRGICSAPVAGVDGTGRRSMHGGVHPLHRPRRPTLPAQRVRADRRARRGARLPRIDWVHQPAGLPRRRPGRKSRFLAAPVTGAATLPGS